MTVFEAGRAAYVARVARPARPRRSVMLPIVIALAGVLGSLVLRARALRREILTLAGLGCVCASAWTYAPWAGLLVTGGALLWLEYLTSPADETAA